MSPTAQLTMGEDSWDRAWMAPAPAAGERARQNEQHSQQTARLVA